jgi:hypothetical protein
MKAAETFYVRADKYYEIVQSLRSSRKIQAIKKLRDATGCHLRAAKLACENLGRRVVENDGNAALNSFPPNYEYDVGMRAMITKVTMVVGEGEVEVDLDTAQFYVMKDLGKVPLAETRRLTTLLTQLEEFCRGEQLDES